MRRAQGYAIWFNPDGPNKERDTVTCGHCNDVFFVKPAANPADEAGFCRVCWSLICATCVGKNCVPFEKKLEEMEKKGYSDKKFHEAIGTQK